MLTKGKFLVSFEVPGHTKDYTEGFTEEMVIPYRTEELNPYLRYPNQEINKNHLHSEFIRLRIREILDICLSDPQAQYNKLLRTQQRLKNKKK